ncbi:hypothetical protein Aeqsu_3113 [Aequorivita sublithincola DSM 14238]|uniref:Uncharacterized protein n=1 Tax=Aequorivita sublithincola (strain DSM 14238 / LMG 21431 / ACAM 643 / 9-3) TaxID=746697 RepID=I3YZY0_AEQSU|nr:hypothetical protein [Aequorivita sublithincola]AFL82548.1 hypothetical protein Aeqsu_3113 [Aequorivita sublithincola DSM 14238]
MLYPKIPIQNKGDYHDFVSTICADSIDEANRNFKNLILRLKSVNDWHSYSEEVNANFSLIDYNTSEITTNVAIDNLIKIDIPGPGSPSGNGSDWTKIIDLQNGLNNYQSPFFAITIRTCSAPGSEDITTVQFYTEESTNTFIVRRIGTCIYAEVHGRNLQENSKDVPLTDLVRNKAIVIGSKIAIRNLKWVALTEALIEPFEIKQNL